MQMSEFLNCKPLRSTVVLLCFIFNY